MVNQLEEFTCIMYRYPRVKSLNEARANMHQKIVGEDNDLTMKSKVDFSRLPPCQDSAIPHFYRVNHRVGVFKRGLQQIPEIPKCYDPNQGWLKNDETIEPIWSLGPILPQSLIDLLIDENNDDHELPEDDDSEIVIDDELNDSEDEALRDMVL